MSNSKSDILLLILLNSRNPIKGIFRLEKLCFLAQERVFEAIKKGPSKLAMLLRNNNKSESIVLNDSYIFLPADFGPYSRKLYEDVFILENEEFLKIDEIEGSEFDSVEERLAGLEFHSGTVRQIALTDEGVILARAIANSSQRLNALIGQTCKDFEYRKTSYLLSYIYNAFPNSAKSGAFEQAIPANV